jgi:hypothetical protein
MLLVVITWAVMLTSVLRPVADVDVFWHVLIGYDIVEHHRFGGDPNWVYGPHDTWVTTQWGSEVVMAGFHHIFGWAGLMVFTGLCGAALLLALAWLARTATGQPLTETPAACVAFAVTGFAFSVDLQERPASVSFVFLAVLSGWAWRALTCTRWPRWWTLTAFTLGWAQLHGYWIMVPLVIAAVTAVHVVTTRTLAGVRTSTVLFIATAAVGVATPAGTYAYVAPVVFRHAAAPFIEEWQPPTIDAPVAWIYAILLITFAVAVHRRRPVPWRLVLWVLGWTVFALLAYRNVLPAMLLILPAVLVATTEARPRWGTRLHGSTLTRAATITVTAAALTAAGWTITTGHALHDDVPERALTILAAQPGERRVLNHYDIGGQVLAFTRPGVRLAIDSRSDMYGRDRIQSYFDLLYTRPGWQRTLAAYHPTDVLIKETDPLNVELERLEWEPVTRDGLYTLWAAPH